MDNLPLTTSSTSSTIAFFIILKSKNKIIFLYLQSISIYSNIFCIKRYRGL